MIRLITMEGIMTTFAVLLLAIAALIFLSGG